MDIPPKMPLPAGQVYCPHCCNVVRPEKVTGGSLVMLALLWLGGLAGAASAPLISILAIIPAVLYLSIAVRPRHICPLCNLTIAR